VSPDAEEVWYDGVDQDCDDASDYDADGDTYDSESYGGDDCDDLDSSVNPGATEVWYDGDDADCAGDDDFDADGDGGQSEAYGGSDCDDNDSSVYSGAPDTWYDGVDSDCDGASDYDADGDGYESESYGGDDCDDTTGSISPDATEVWYDGVDSDCDDASDYDADGDTYDSDLHGGDDCDDDDRSVNPAATEIWYDGVDSDCDGASDYDADGDGYDSEDHGGADCDDNDGKVGEPTDETLNSSDDDCDGTVDNLAVSDAATGVLYGYETDHELGHQGSMGMVGDVDDDGAVDLVIATRAIDEGYAWVVDGTTAMRASGGIDGSYSAMVEGDHSARALGYVLSPSADEDGDGVVDLLVGGSSTHWYYTSFGRSYLYLGGTSISGTLDIDLYDASFTGDSSGDNMRLAGLADIDGDGFADVVASSRYDSSWDSSDWRPYHGNVAVFGGGSLTTASDPRYDPALSDHAFEGTSGYDYLGASLMLADLDSDGYSDIIAGAPGDDDGASDAGAVYIFTGNSSLSWNTDADTAAAIKITGDTADDEFGSDTIPSAGDVDGDGRLDLLIAAEDVGEAWLFLTAGALGSSPSASSADHVWSGTAGDFASAACIDSDLDGDGADEVALGGDSADVSSSNSGVVYLYFHDSSWSSSLTSSDADATIWGDDSSDYLGTGLAGGQDLNGDGFEDLLVGAVGVDDGTSDGGAVYIIAGW